MKRVLAGFLIYVAVLGALAVWRWHVWSYGTDTGTFAQVALDAFGGFHDGPEDTTHFAFHWAPLLAVLYPVVKLTGTPLSIQFVEAILIGAAVFPFYALVRRYTSEDLASRIALLLLLYPPLFAVAFDEFHEIAFYPLLTFAVLWAIDAGAWRWFAVASVLIMLVREEVPIVIAVLGAAIVIASWRSLGRDGLLFWQPRQPRGAALAGAWLSLASLLTLGAYFGVVIPALGGWRPAHFYEYPFAHGPLGLLVALVLHPVTVTAAIATFGRLTYLLEAFTPLAFLPLRSRWMLVALPALAIVILSSDPITWRMGSHYAAIWIPWLLAGAAAAIVGFERARSTALAKRAVTICYALCAVFLIALNPAHVGHYLKTPYADHADALRALALVPESDSVITHDEFFAQIATRYPKATVFWREPGPQYAVFADDFQNGPFQTELLPRMRRETAEGHYRIVARFGQVVVYRREAP